MIDQINSLDFHQVYEHLTFPMLILSSGQTILFANQAFYNTTKYSKDEIHEIQFNKIIGDENIEFWEFLTPDNKPRRPVLLELKVINKNQSKIRVHSKCSQIISTDGQKSFFLIQFTETFEKNKKSEQFIKQHDLLNQLINSIPDNIFAKDTKSRFILANKWISEVMGAKSPTELIGKTDFDYYPEALAKKYFADEQEVIKTGNPKINIIEKVIIQEKTVCWYSTTKVPIFGENNQVVGIMGIGRDITKSIKEKEKLRRAKRTAEKADKLKSSFVANMSHEIRTPLNGILGFSQFLRRNDLPIDKKERYLDIILFNGKQLLNLINDIIDISKIDAGHISITYKAFPVNDILNKLYQTFLAELKTQKKDDIKLILQVGLPDNDSYINSDDFRLKQILINLLYNAIKFTEKGSITFGYLAPSKGHIEFFVKDTGIGINKSYQRIIFDRFRQVDDSSTRKYGGTGLGLSISKGLVELLGGKIWVKSTLHKGSTFYFSLPYIHITNRQYTKTDDIDEVITNLKGKTILIAEDDPDSIRLLMGFLKKEKVKIIHAKNGGIAIDIIKSGKTIDLVLMDMKMPKIDGYKATREIKQINPKLPVIAQTAYALKEDRDKCLKAGCDDYISKPIDVELLLKIIRNYIC